MLHKMFTILIACTFMLPVVLFAQTAKKAKEEPKTQASGGTSSAVKEVQIPDTVEFKTTHKIIDSLYEVKLAKEINSFIMNYLNALLGDENIDTYKLLTPRKTIKTFWEWRAQQKPVQ